MQCREDGNTTKEFGDEAVCLEIWSGEAFKRGWRNLGSGRRGDRWEREGSAKSDGLDHQLSGTCTCLMIWENANRRVIGLTPLPSRLLTILSSPTKAPESTNRILVVSTTKVSPFPPGNLSFNLTQKDLR